MFEKKAVTRVPIDSVLARRWSGRAYDPDREVTYEQIIALLEAARWAPSCFGDQPWRFIICNKAADARAWRNALDCLSEGNREWAGKAPVLMIITADTVFNANGKPNRWGQYDTGAAAMSLCVQATAMGLMVHQMGGFDADKARAVFAVPERYIPMAFISVGYQLPLEAIPGELKEREQAGRLRRPLEQSFFDGSWGKPVKL